MAKKIILCSDGTGNKALKGRGTNVFKIYEAVKRKDTQLVFYDDGVGTEGFKLRCILGGAFGLGLSQNVKDLYIHLARCYEPGDEIYLFGFSRGAYTVRILAGFILQCGILDRDKFASDGELRNCVDGAYKAYRRKYKTWTSRLWSVFFSWLTKILYKFTSFEEIRKKTHENGKAKIDFIGVWDTVSALGVPYKVLADLIDALIFKFKFPDNDLNEKVIKACHALSIDDKRKTFHPELWNETAENTDKIEQVWFAGVHANVGGGYPKHGMSLVSLAWMMKKAGNGGKGIEFIDNDKAFYEQHANVHDKLYDSRAGLAAFYPYAPRDIHGLCKKHGVIPHIHETVYERSVRLTEAYAPGNLPIDMVFVDSDGTAVLQDETKNITGKMKGDTSLLERVKPWIRLRQWLQAIFIILTAAVVYLVCQEYSVSMLSRLVAGKATLKEMVEIVKYLSYAGVVAPMLLVYYLSRKARGKIQAVYSRFWYKLKK